jgi:hypothetical protein
MKSSFLFVSMLSSVVLASTESLSLSESYTHQFKVTGSDHLIFSNAKDDVDRTALPTQLWMNEGKVRAEYGDWNGDLHFTNQYQPSSISKTSPSVALEKKSIHYESKNWQLVLGDSHQELGRGMALSLYSEPVFGIDNTLEGASAKYRPENFEVSAWGGRVNALSIPVAINPVDMRMKDRNVLMASGSIAYKFSSDSKLGGHYLLTLNQRKSDLDLDNRFQTAGLHFSQDNIADMFDFYCLGRQLGEESNS